MAEAEEEQQETVGEVLFCGATDFDTIWSGTRNEKYNDILRPSRISVFMDKKISLVASGPSAAHSVIVAEDGCYTERQRERISFHVVFLGLALRNHEERDAVRVL